MSLINKIKILFKKDPNFQYGKSPYRTTGKLTNRRNYIEKSIKYRNHKNDDHK